MGSRHFLFLLVLSLSFFAGSALNANQQFKYYMTSASGLPGDSVDLHVLFDNEKDQVEAWFLGVCHDASMLTIINADNGETTQAFNGGSGPDLSFYNINPPGDPGWNSAMVISIVGPDTMRPGEGFDLHIATYTLIGDPGTESVNTLVCPCHEQIGDPPMPNLAVVGGFSFPVDTECGEVHILPDRFTRGDCNGDGNINIGDPIFLLNELFFEGPEAPCDDACDFNDDSGKDIGDAIYGLNHLFAQGPAPPAPFPGCGSDPTADALGCGSFAACP